MEEKKQERDLIVMIGMTLSGKTYQVDLNYLPEHQLVSKYYVTQALRTSKLPQDPNIVPMTMEMMVRAHMVRGLPIVVDESNLEVDSLFLWKSITREFGYNIKGIFLDTPLDVCTARLKYILKDQPITEDMHAKLSSEFEKVEELKTLLKMKHQKLLDKVTFINYDGG